MEALEQYHKRVSSDLFSDPAMRLRSRPTAVPPGEGRAHDDFGSDLAPRTRSQKSELHRPKRDTRRNSPAHADSDSDPDELDFLSRRGSADTVMSLRGARPVENGVITTDNQFIRYHPDHHPPKFPLPKFKKKLAHEGQLPSTSSNPSISRPKASAMRKRSPSPVRGNARKEVLPHDFYATSSGLSRSIDDAQATLRPRPRPTYKNKITAKPGPAPAPFRNLSPISNLRRADISNPDSGSHLKAKPFPTISPPSSLAKVPPKLQPKAFPSLSPFGSPVAKGKNRAVDAWHDREDAEESEASLPSSMPSTRPFPLSSKFFHSNQTLPVSKRSPEDSDQDDDSPRKKRKADDPEKLPISSLILDEPSGINEQDLLFLDPGVDPSTLCPWCDEPLPLEPTPHLMSLIESVRGKSYHSTRPTNPLGLKASVGAYVAVCKRHRFESHQVPLAKAKGWPTRIDFSKVKDRVEALKEDLKALILDRYPSDDWNLELNVDGLRPRSKSLFWQELVGDVKAKGTRAMASAKGQFANFDKLQPGYYGELGYIIIHQTIYQLFPPSSIDPNSVSPLSPQEFTQRILIPEAAVALIMEDLDLNKMRAIQTLRESVEYGVAMFPDTGEGGEAADKMIKERASVRRKELEIEEAQEKVPKNKNRRDHRLPSAEPARPKPRPKHKEQIIDIEDDLVIGATGNLECVANSKAKKRTMQEDGDTTDTSTSRANSSSKRGRPISSRTRRSRAEHLDSEVELMSDSSKASTHTRTNPTARGPFSDSEGSIPDSSNSGQHEPHVRRSLSNDCDMECLSVEETPRASKVQKHSSKDLRPLNMARQRIRSVTPH